MNNHKQDARALSSQTISIPSRYPSLFLGFSLLDKSIRNHKYSIISTDIYWSPIVSDDEHMEE